MSTTKYRRVSRPLSREERMLHESIVGAMQGAGRPRTAPCRCRLPEGHSASGGFHQKPHPEHEDWPPVVYERCPAQTAAVRRRREAMLPEESVEKQEARQERFLDGLEED